MHQTLFAGIETLSLAIGMIGIMVILVGAVQALFEFLRTYSKGEFQHIRLVLNSHIILGLDFLVGKDIIDTILLAPGHDFWKDITGLVAVVIIRIVLTYFMEKEIEIIKKDTGKARVGKK